VTFKNNSGTPTSTVEYTYDYLDRRILKKTDSNGPTAGGVDQFYNIYQGDHAALKIHDQNGLATGGAGQQLPHVEYRYLYGPAVDEILASDNGLGPRTKRATSSASFRTAFAWAAGRTPAAWALPARAPPAESYRRTDRNAVRLLKTQLPEGADQSRCQYAGYCEPSACCDLRSAVRRVFQRIAIRRTIATPHITATVSMFATLSYNGT
jgi:hypothetical protein